MPETSNTAWQSLAGQAPVVALLRASIERNRVAHAYLFSGPPGAPLIDTARVFAMALNCETRRACGACDPCAKILARIHPDVVTLEREGAAQIVPIEVVRTQVLARIGLPPHEAETRVFILEEATAVQPAAANALLKTLEEPPTRSVFVLCTTAPEQLLPTIRSRCQRVRFSGAHGLDRVGGLMTPGDAQRAERLAALAAELAADAHDMTLPSRVAEGKGETGGILIAAAQRLHELAKTAAVDDPQRARRAGVRAQAILTWHTAVAVHNANPQLAIEALIVQLGALDPVNRQVNQ